MTRRATLREELESFANVWSGGYYEGDPLDPLGASSYGTFGYISVLHAVYLHCIRPYVTNDTHVLEIGPGRGAWTKTLLHAREVWCLDAKSRIDNAIDDFLGSPENLRYYQVKDFSCRELPDNYFDYMFSFGALCHVSWSGVSQYATNLYSKLRPGAVAFWMVADYDKANRLLSERSRFDAFKRIAATKRIRLLRGAERVLGRAFGANSLFLERLSPRARMALESLVSPSFVRSGFPIKNKAEDDAPRPGRWYHTGTARLAALLRNIGFHVVQDDVGLVPRDPIIHFVKPT